MSALGEESKARPTERDAMPLAVPRAAWWLPGPHLPTIFGKVIRRVPETPTSRERWPTPDGDVFSVERLRGQAGAPRLVIFHGLEGGLHSTYARGLLHQAYQRGWWADLVLWRTCDGVTVNAVRRSYHSGASDDADVALTRIIRADPDRPTLLHGVSLGGNVLLKWLGERGDTVPAAIRAAVAVSVPFDLAAASARIDRGWSRLYGRFFLRTLKAKTAAKLSRYPDVIDGSVLSRIRTLWEFDELVTGPVHGFRGAAEYYAQSSSINFLNRVRVPTLLLSSRNDPFLPPSVLDRVAVIASNNPCVTCCFPRSGGHVGFIGGKTPLTADYWMERATLDWLQAIALGPSMRLDQRLL